MCFSYTYTHILFLKLFSIKGYYKVLTIGPCVCVCAQSLSHVRLFVTCGLLSSRLLRPLQADSYRLSPREAHSGGNRLVDPGNHTQTQRPLPGWANSHLLDVGEETKRAIMAANPVFNCPWIYCRSGQKGSSPRSQVGSGQRNGTLSLGARVLNPGLSVYSTQSPKLCLTAVSVARSVSAFGC